jgi:hypothetical protein
MLVFRSPHVSSSRGCHFLPFSAIRIHLHPSASLRRVASNSACLGSQTFSLLTVSPFWLTACPAKCRIWRDNARFLALSRIRALRERCYSRPICRAADLYSLRRANAAPFGSIKKDVKEKSFPASWKPRRVSASSPAPLPLCRCLEA